MGVESWFEMQVKRMEDLLKNLGPRSYMPVRWVGRDSKVCPELRLEN